MIINLQLLVVLQYREKEQRVRDFLFQNITKILASGIPNMDNNVEQPVSSTAADDSDNDEVIDFLNSNCVPNTDITVNYKSNTTDASDTTSPIDPAAHSSSNDVATNGIIETNARREETRNNTEESENYCIPVINTSPHLNATSASRPVVSSNNNNISNNLSSNLSALRQNDNNMIPTINVTPHSPANVSKYNNIFEDTLSQLQNIRESVVQMKNSSSAHMTDGLSNYGLVNAAILSASLPDLSPSANGVASSSGAGPHGPLASHFVIWSPQQQQQYLLNADRRKSWTGIDDLTAGGDCTNKSVSLSSLDSEEQETIRVTEQRRRSARNSTGGEYNKN